LASASRLKQAMASGVTCSSRADLPGSFSRSSRAWRPRQRLGDSQYLPGPLFRRERGRHVGQTLICRPARSINAVRPHSNCKPPASSSRSATESRAGLRIQPSPSMPNGRLSKPL
jgi:hypothetical protein